jgi:hypothetical protein
MPFKAVVTVNELTRAVERVTVDGEAAEVVDVVSAGAAPEVPSCVVLDFSPGTGDARLAAALRLCAPPRALAAVPWHGARVPPGCSYAEGLAVILPADRPPEPNAFFPLNWCYASGIALVEVEPVLDERSGTALSREFFLSERFGESRAALSAALRGANRHEDLPGFILQDTAAQLAPYAHGTRPADDPLLRRHRPADGARLRLQADDYIMFGSSDWDTASRETKTGAGHAPGARHYYAAVRYALPVESVDQLKMLVYLNPNNDTWRKLASRKPFERALETARAARAGFLRDALAGAGLRPRRSCPHVTDTASDVFDDDVIRVDTGDETAGEGIAFFSGCAPTHRAERGLVTEMGPERDAGLLWLHGPPSAKTGGEPWKQALSANSVPVRTPSRVTRRTLDAFERAGWDKTNGYVKIEPIVFI